MQGRRPNLFGSSCRPGRDGVGAPLVPLESPLGLATEPGLRAVRLAPVRSKRSSGSPEPEAHEGLCCALNQNRGALPLCMMQLRTASVGVSAWSRSTRPSGLSTGVPCLKSHWWVPPSGARRVSPSARAAAGGLCPQVGRSRLAGWFLASYCPGWPGERRGGGGRCGGSVPARFFRLPGRWPCW